MSTTLPFTMIEESVHHIEQTFEPWNIQGELETTETVDLDRLAEASTVVQGVHPLAGARRRPSRLADFRYSWELPDDPDPVDVIEVDSDEVDLETAQNELYYRTFDLTSEPPFKLMVYRGGGIDGGDRMLLSMSHVAADGVGMLRVAQALCEAYRGVEPMEDWVSLDESRDMLQDISPSGLADRIDALGSVVRQLGKSLDEPARIAAEGGSDQSGWGFVRRRLDEGLTARLVENRPDGVSVNDVLLAALHLAIADWNEDHGERAGRISVMMPVNLRPEDWFYQVVAMYSMFESVETRRSDRRSPTKTVEAVADQTAELKERDRAAAIYKALKMLPPGTPVGLKQQLPEIFRGPGERLLDSAMLTNLGNIPTVPSLSGDGEERPWFSPPTWDATPMGIGVATFEGRVNLSCRYMRNRFDADGAGRFVDYYVDNVERIVAADLSG